MQIETFSGEIVAGPIDIANYWTDRKHQDLYRLTVGMARAMFPAARSAIDVGCFTSALIVEMDWIPIRVASDIKEYLKANWEGVAGVDFEARNAFEIADDSLFDLVISNQTIEHLEDPKGFVEKLLSIGRGLIISTTYETPAGMIDGHIQDPISLEKFLSWFSVELDAYTICSHPSRQIHHIIAVIASSHPNKIEVPGKRDC
jgi:2-polyprenyl-3-methyl-5-hydroxy-6-metoxy-1,4-benzoquinol methylase